MTYRIKYAKEKIFTSNAYMSRQQRWSQTRSGFRPESTIFAGEGASSGFGIWSKNQTRSYSI